MERRGAAMRHFGEFSIRDRRYAERLLVALLACSAWAGASAQLSAPNAAGVAMGHLHYVVRDVAANQAFWTKLGGQPVTLGTTAGVLFPDVVLLLQQGETTAGTEGSVVNHVAFRMKSLAAVERAGIKVELNPTYPGVASVFTPEGERIELFDDEFATNLTFTIDGGAHDTFAERHNRKIEVPIIAHHIHLNVPEGQVEAAKEWYATRFGGVRGKRWRYDAVDLPGININISAVPAAQAPTRGRQLDHIGFEITHLEAFCKQLEAAGIKFDRPYTKLESGLGLAFLTDPWGTYIELTEGLRAVH
jgi:catechol 2,3-dioxygenase-like lactoylglutathione lyase family enzyme